MSDLGCPEAREDCRRSRADDDDRTYRVTSFEFLNSEAQRTYVLSLYSLPTEDRTVEEKIMRAWKSLTNPASHHECYDQSTVLSTIYANGGRAKGMTVYVRILASVESGYNSTVEGF